MYQGRIDDAKLAVALTHTNGDLSNPIVLSQFKQIEDTITWEKNNAETLSVKQMFKTKTARKRVLLAVSCAVFSTIAGFVLFLLFSFYCLADLRY